MENKDILAKLKALTSAMEDYLDKMDMARIGQQSEHEYCYCVPSAFFLHSFDYVIDFVHRECFQPLCPTEYDVHARLDRQRLSKHLKKHERRFMRKWKKYHILLGA